MSLVIGYDPTIPVTIHPISHSPHTFAYRIWKAAPGETSWQIIEDGDINTPVKSYGPFPQGTHIDYRVLMGGNPNTTWSTEMRFSQRGNQLSCSPSTDTGQTDASGIGSVEAIVILQ